MLPLGKLAPSYGVDGGAVGVALDDATALSMDMDRWMDHASHATAGIHGERKQIKDGREAGGGENN
jgi:hypothetical protein